MLCRLQRPLHCYVTFRTMSNANPNPNANGNSNPAHTVEEAAFVRDRSSALQGEYDAYLRSHPELTALLNDFVADVMLHKPVDVYAHASSFFSRVASVATPATSASSSSDATNNAPRPIVVVGPSGVGKGTLIERLMKEFPDKFGFSVSHTTRKPRPGEVNGVHYHFAERADMETLKAAGGFVETAEVHGNMYGTSLKAVADVASQGKTCILDIDVQGARSVKKSSLPAIYLFVKPPSIGELEKRLRGRGTETEEKIQLRLGNAKAELEFADNSAGFFDHVVVNDDLEKTYEQVRQIALRAANGGI